jgi:histidine ammonia-lyase
MTSALLTLGVTAGSLAAEMPTTAAPISVDATASATQTADTTAKPAKKHKKKKKAAAATAS